MIRVFVMIGCLLGLFATSAQAAPTRVVADLSEQQVGITSSYHGTELLLFGAVEGIPGDDVIIVVTGPETRMAQRRKDKVAGIWVNVETNIWENAPSFYHVYTTRLIDQIADFETLTASGIGTASLDLKVAPERKRNSDDRDATPAEPLDATAMTGTLIRNLQNMGLWKIHHAGIKVLGDRLFRATLQLPKNVPPGDYKIRVVHFRDGIAIGQETTDMVIKKAGLSALIYKFAHEYSLFYGLFAIAFAVGSGWLAAVAFRR